MTSLLPQNPHCGLIIGATACGKTVFVLDLLQTHYNGRFDNIIIFCPTIKYNKTYLERDFIWSDDQVFVVDPQGKLSENLEFFFNLFEGTGDVLFIIDDCSAEKDIIQKRHALSKLAFSGRHAGIYVWILSQKYNAVLKDFREQLKWVCLFYCKDRDSFETCLRENDVVESKEQRDKLKEQLKRTPHSKLILKTDQPTGYKIIQ